MLTFFYSTGTCSTACHIALKEAGLPFRGIEVSWQRSLHLAELDAVNPLGQVPVLVHEGKALTQTLAVLAYIAERAPRLLPEKGSWEHSQAMSWLAFIAADFQKGFGPLLGAARWTESEAAQASIKNAALLNLGKYLAHIDHSLAGKDYILGTEFSVVDAYLFVVAGWCKWAGIKIGKYSHLSAYMKRVNARPAVQEVLAKEELFAYLPE